MAFKDGMKAISKICKIAGSVVGALGLAFFVASTLGGDIKSGIFYMLPIALLSLLLFAPAWVIDKFIE